MRRFFHSVCALHHRFTLACPHFRGRDDAKFPNGEQFGCPREMLANLSKAHPDKIDVVLNADGVPMINQTRWK